MLHIPLVSLALFVVAAVISGLAIYGLLNIRVRGARVFSLLMVSFTFYIAGFAMELMTPTAAGILFWLKIEYIGIATIPTLCIFLAIRLAGKDSWFHTWLIRVVFILPIITLALYFTNSWHHLFYRHIGEVRQVLTYYELGITKGPWYYVNVAYLNLALAISVILFAKKLRQDVVERQQAWILIIGCSGPWIAHLVYQSGLTHGFDISPFGFLLTAPLFAWGVFRNYMVFLLPKARNSVYQSFGDAVLIVDNEKNLIDFNKSAGALFKMLNRDSIGKPISVSFSGLPEIRELIECREDQRLPVTVVLDKVKRSFILTNAGVMSRQEHRLGTIVAFHETTDQVFLLDNLRESEEKYRLIFENTPVGVFQYDTAGRITTCNNSFVKVFGSSRKQLIGLNLMNLADKDLVQAIADSLTGAVGFYEQEYEQMHSRKKVPLRGYFASITSKNGDIRGGVGIVEDFSEKYQSDRQIKYKEEFESLLMALELDFLNTDISDIEGTFNKGLMKMGMFCKVDRAYVFSFDSVRGVMTRSYAWRAAGLEIEMNDLFSMSISEAPILLEHLTNTEIINLPNLELLPQEWSQEIHLLALSNVKSMLIVPLKVGGELLGFAGFDSIREQRVWTKDEIVLFQIMGRVFASVMKRKESSEQLILARDRAEEANRVKSIFLANMSHEIRTPLNGILGVAEMMKAESDDPMAHKYAEIIQESGDRLLFTLSQILDLSRAESGTLDLVFEQVNVDRVIDHVISFFSNAARQKGLFIERQHGGARFALTVDEQLFKSAISYLINNSIKFTKQGGITVSTDFTVSNQQRFGVIRISDTGIGISEKDLDSIFEQFRQVSEGTKKDFEGTGLGLSLTKKYVELIGGQIRVESLQGFGTTFILSFPDPIKER